MNVKGFNDLSEFFFLPPENSDTNTSFAESKSDLQPPDVSERELQYVPEDRSKSHKYSGESDFETKIDLYGSSALDRSGDVGGHLEGSEIDANIYDVAYAEYHAERLGLNMIAEKSLEDSFKLLQYEDTDETTRADGGNSHKGKIFCRSRAPSCRVVDKDHPFSCPFCSKSFNKNWRLSCHMEQVHTKIRNFACSDCDKKFRSDYDLKRHSTTHTGQRFVCYHCDAGFASKQRVACHIRRSLTCWDRKS